MNQIVIKNTPTDRFARAYVNMGLNGLVEVLRVDGYTTDERWPMHSSAGEVVTLSELLDRKREINAAVRAARVAG